MIKLLTQIAAIRELQEAVEEAPALARWLNRSENHPLRDGVGPMIASYILDCQSAKADKSGRHVMTGMRDIVVRLRAVTRTEGARVRFRLEGIDEQDRMLHVFERLHSGDEALRLRYCPGCGKFWYCEGRLDKKACSDRCRVLLWQKTPEGRKHRAEYMRRYRATIKKLWDAKRGKRGIKRGRKIHPDLKKGE